MIFNGVVENSIGLLFKRYHILENWSLTPPPIPKGLSKHIKKLDKVKWIIFNSMKDQFIPHQKYKKMVKDMCDSSINLYQSMNISHGILLKIKSLVHKSNIDMVVRYVMNITNFINWQVTTSNLVHYGDLVRITMKGFHTSWGMFVWVVCAHDKFPTFEKICDDFV